MFVHRLKKLTQFRSLSTSTSKLTANLNIKSLHDENKLGENITIKGWVKAIRKMKSTVFLDINDGSCNNVLQVTLPAEKKHELVTYGASVEAIGQLGLTPKQQLELKANEVKLIGKCAVSDNYPFAPRKVYPPDYVRKFLHMRSRTSKQSALLRVRSRATLETHNFFINDNFVHVHTPILTSNDCEGAGEVFRVQPESMTTLKMMAKKDVPLDQAYFNTKAYLTVSGQLHLEAAAHGLSNVYTFGPTFRAENSRSTLHLSEFYMIEAEKAFVTNLLDITKLCEDMIKSIAEKTLSACESDFKKISDDNDVKYDWINKEFGVMEYDEAIDILLKSNQKFSTPVEKNQALSKEHEFYLVQHNNNIPLFVINWPKEIKSFYMKQNESDESKVAAFDLFAPGVGELAGGSLRENNYDLLKQRLPNSDNFEWYLQLREFGNVPTGGFGLGFERLLQFLTGISNIKDTIPFPRWPHNCML